MLSRLVAALALFAASTGVAAAVPVCAACRAAPAPLIGAGLPVALVIGGVLLGRRLIRRR